MNWAFWYREDKPGRVVVGGDVAWFTAREYARTVLHHDELDCAHTYDVPQVWLAWEGHDGGRYPMRRLRVLDRRALWVRALETRTP